MLRKKCISSVVIGTALLGLVAIASACGGDDKAASSVPGNTFVVEISDNKFSPVSLTVPKDTKVKWTWTGNNPHSLVGKFGSKDVSSEQHKGSGTFELTLDTPGTYSYQCGVHGAAMAGKIIVQ
jgi:plastocyanin